MRGSLKLLRQLWANASLSSKGLAVMSIPVLALILTSSLLYVVNLSYKRTVEEALQGQELHLQVQHVTLLMIQVDAAARRYLATGTTENRATFNEAKAHLQAKLDTLRTLETASPTLQERVRSVAASATDMMIDVQGLIDNSSASPVLRGQGLARLNTRIDMLFQDVNTLFADWERLSAQQVANRRQANDSQLVLILAIELAGLIGGLAAVLLLSRQVINQVSRLAENAQRLADKQPLLPLDVGNDEIGALAKTLAETSGMLAERDRRLDLALKGSGAVIWEADVATGKLEVSGNPEGLARAGLTATTVPDLGTWLTMVAPESLPEIYQAMEKARHSPEPFHVEYRMKLPDGHERWLESRGQKITGPDSMPKVLGVVLDVTERHENERALRDREAALAAVIAASPDLISILDLDGRIRVASPAIHRMLGVTPRDREGYLLPDFVHPDDRERVMAGLESLKEPGEPLILQYRVRHAAGHWVILSTHGQTLTDAEGKATGIVLLTRDKTETVQLQQALQQSKEDAVRANRAKSDFLSHMSHELRTPLNAVLGFAQVLEMTDQSRDQQEATQHILKAGKHLLRLINEVLDIAGIEAGRLAVLVEPIRVAQVVQDSCDLIAPLARESGVTLRSALTACDCHVRADGHRLRQVLLNLLSNAVKYNHEGGTVTISCTKLSPNRLRLAVADTGRGIPPELHCKVFRPFERLGLDHTRIEGTGIGLALSKSLVELMGGDIGLESRPGQGSTFWVELPIAAAPHTTVKR